MLEIEINSYIENYKARHKIMLSKTYKTCPKWNILIFLWEKSADVPETPICLFIPSGNMAMSKPDVQKQFPHLLK